MSGTRGRLDDLLDDSRAECLPDDFIEQLLITLRDSEQGGDPSEGREMIRRSTELWEHPSVQYRLRRLERELWARRLQTASPHHTIELQRRSFRLIPQANQSATRLNPKIAIPAPAIGREPSWHLLPVALEVELNRDLTQLPVGAVIVKTEDTNIGRINEAVLADEE